MNIRKLVILTVAATLALSACSTKTQTVTSPTIAPQVLYTAAAQTASARMTLTAQAVPSDTPSPSATFTPEASSTPTPTLTPLFSATPSPTATSSLVDHSVYVADVTVPDGTAFTPGTKFTKTWRVQNNGTSTWTTNYSLVFISGDKMGGPDMVKVPLAVAPGTSIDLSVELVAPAEIKHYRGYWKLLNGAGRFFDDPMYVDINVAASATAAPTTASASPTPTTNAALTITNATTSVDSASFTGACPHTLNVTAKFTLSKAASVTSQLEAGSSTPGFTFTLPPAQTLSLMAGDHTLTYSLDLTQSVTGWVQLHITAPIDVISSQAQFTLTCQP